MQLDFRAADHQLLDKERVIKAENGQRLSTPDRQYSSASMIVMTRSVTDGSEGSGE
jgi:hypothetical protein